MNRVLRVPVASLAARDRALVSDGARQIVVFRQGDAIHAFDNACPHEGNPLVDGDVLGDVLVCAYHGWRFDLGSGACLQGDEPVRRYPAEVRGDEIWIRVV